MTVYLVGAGPGDPGLLTVLGAQLLERADVVVHDRLVEDSILARARPGALRIDVGKRPGAATFGQDEINALLVEHGRGGGVVVRLKGGDPYLFGRGGEEVLALEAAGVECVVVPGVSAALAAPAAAGVPVTHRGTAASLTVLSGHDADGAGSEALEGAAGGGATLVVLMGAATRAALAKRLLAAGRPGATPVVVVEHATTPRQRSRRTTLDGLGDLEVESPATIVVGPVAALGLGGYESRPLHGWRVVVTRPAAQSASLLEALTGAGAAPVAFPTIEVAAPRDGGAALDGATRRLHDFEWVVLASANAASALLGRLHDARDLGGVKVAAVGPETARVLADFGVLADLVPDNAQAESLVAAFGPSDGAATVLLPRAQEGRDTLAVGLSALGWRVESVEAYRTVSVEPAPGALETLVGADAITFASSSAVTGFLAGAGTRLVPPVVASIGPATSATLVAAGVRVDVEATTHSASGLVAALVDFARRRRDVDGPAEGP